MATDTRQFSTFVCAFCGYEDIPRLLKAHLIDEHAVEIASQHWDTHIHRVRSNADERCYGSNRRRVSKN